MRTRSSRGEPTQGEVASSAKVAPVRVDAVPSQVITELAPQPVSSGELAEVDEEALALTLLQVDVGIGPELERAWEAERWLVKQLRDTMVRSGGRLMVAYVTTREEVDEELFARWLASLSPGAPIAAIDPHRGAARLGQICEELGVPFVDLVPAFDAYGDPAALFIPANGHWSAEGHALAAAVVAERLAALMDS